MDLADLALRDYTEGMALKGSGERTTLRRCRNREQGTALVMVGHAIEYLVDSRLGAPLATLEESPKLADREALAILLQANLTVYNEGAEIQGITARLRRWFESGSAKPVKPAKPAKGALQRTA